MVTLSAMATTITFSDDQAARLKALLRVTDLSTPDIPQSIIDTMRDVPPDKRWVEVVTTNQNP